MICSRDRHQKYSVAVVNDTSSAGQVIENATLRRRNGIIVPTIKFAGKVTVSGLKYAIDEL